MQLDRHTQPTSHLWIGEHWAVRDEESRRKGSIYVLTNGHKIDIKYKVALVPAMQLDQNVHVL